MILPLQDNELLDFIENQNKVFDIDYKGSSLKGDIAFTYLSNLQLKCRFDLQNLTQEELFELLVAYMKTDKIVSVENLEKAVIGIFLLYNGIEIDGFDYGLIRETAQSFIDANKQLVERWSDVLNSMFLYSILCYGNKIDRETAQKDLDVITDKNYIGLNFVNLFKYPEFYCYFIVKEIKPVTYFKPYFEDLMFDGNNLYYYFNTETNLILKGVGSVLNEEVEKKDVSSV